MSLIPKCPTCRTTFRTLRGAVEHEHANKHEECLWVEDPGPTPIPHMLARELAGWPIEKEQS